MRVLGVDPGLGCTGYALVDQGLHQSAKLVEAGTIRTDARLPLPERLDQLFRDLTSVIEDLTPAAMALEDLYMEYRFPRTALLMAHARGAICLAAARGGLPVWSFPPAQIKVSVVGHGSASKEQVQAMVARTFSLAQPPTPNDVADAMAVALTAHRRGPTSSSAWMVAPARKRSE
jgi:crossover junction endodeoxyribonuclease RuvC